MNLSQRRKVESAAHEIAQVIVEAETEGTTRGIQALRFAVSHLDKAMRQKVQP